jgi:lysophospholipase L1-like esterase
MHRRRNIARIVHRVAARTALGDDAPPAEDSVAGDTARRPIRTLGLAVAATALALACAELVARAIAPGIQVVFRETVQASANPVLDYELRPGARDGAARISRQGLRDDELVGPKPAGVIRIAAAGDSLTYGSGGPRELGWVERLEASFAMDAAGAPRVEVWNLGVPGYNATQVAERVRSAGLPLEPDVIVYGYTLNDPQAFSLEGAALRQMRSEASETEGGSLEAGWLRRQLARSHLVVWAKTVIAAPRRPRSMPEDPAYAAAVQGDETAYVRALHDDPDSWNRVEDALTRLAEISRERGVPVLVVLFPLFADGEPGDALDDVRARVADAASARGLEVVDLSPVYAEAGRRFGRRMDVDFLHPNAFGHRIAAHAIRVALCRMDRLPALASRCASAPPGDALDAKLAELAAETLGG